MSAEREVWIGVVIPEGYEVEVRSMVSSATDLLHSAVSAIDHEAQAEVFTTEEMRNRFRGPRNPPHPASTVREGHTDA